MLLPKKKTEPLPFVAGLAVGVLRRSRNRRRYSKRYGTLAAEVGDGLKACARELGPGAVGVPGEKMTAGIEMAEGEKA